MQKYSVLKIQEVKNYDHNQDSKIDKSFWVNTAALRI
jgi:hypothetical protein